MSLEFRSSRPPWRELFASSSFFGAQGLSSGTGREWNRTWELGMASSDLRWVSQHLAGSSLGLTKYTVEEPVRGETGAGQGEPHPENRTDLTRKLKDWPQARSVHRKDFA